MFGTRWFNRRISFRIFAGFALVAVLTTLVAVVSIVYLRGVSQDIALSSDRLRLLQTNAVELRLSVEQESDSVRGYLLTGDESFQAATANATASYTTTMNDLKSLAAPADVRFLADVDRLHSDFLNIAVEQANLRDQGFPSTASFLWETQGKGLKDALDTKLADLITQRDTEVTVYNGQARKTQNSALALALGIVGLTWFAGIGGGIVISRSITRPIERLVAATDEIREGKLNVRVPAPGDDELGKLGGALNRMAQGVEEWKATADALYIQEQRKAEHLRAVNEVGRQMSSILSLDKLLPYVAKLLRRTFKYNAVNIFLFDRESGSLILKAAAGNPDETAVLGTLIQKGEDGILPWVAEKGETLLVPDVAAGKWRLQAGAGQRTRAELAVPVKVQDHVVGILDIQSHVTNAFDEADQFIAETLSSQLAVAIENARLYEQASELAAMQERQRLARDLHDAVTQTLFSASLIADVLPRIWKRDSADGERRLEQLRQLTRGALAEMRMLLLELRPAALTEVGLGTLLHHLSDAAAGRAGLKVALTVEEECSIPVPVQMAFYRVAQEATNNIIKHAAASEVSVRFTCRPGSAELSVSDNGAGFSPAVVTGDHLGLRIMRERAEAAGADLNVNSEIGHGTAVVLRWPGAGSER